LHGLSVLFFLISLIDEKAEPAMGTLWSSSSRLGAADAPSDRCSPSHDKPRTEALNAVARMYNIRKLRAIIRAFADAVVSGERNPWPLPFQADIDHRRISVEPDL
jgi:hypothetical protein